ncbi:MAG TPA: hypothetical protein IAC79_06580, partial [Candidatus Spyradenecus faecavium]|nr:hypothetical protein [Candidatus Spyradenecus faecavium]
ADGEGAFGDGLGGGDGLEEGAVEGVLEAGDDAVDGAAGLKGGAGAGGGPGFAELLRAADVVGREDGGDGLAEGGEVGLPGVDVGLEGGASRQTRAVGDSKAKQVSASASPVSQTWRVQPGRSRVVVFIVGSFLL